MSGAFVFKMIPIQEHANIVKPGKGIENGRVQRLLSIHEKLEPTVSQHMSEQVPQQHTQHRGDALSCDAGGVLLVLNMGNGGMHILPSAACLLMIDDVGLLTLTGRCRLNLHHCAYRLIARRSRLRIVRRFTTQYRWRDLAR